MPVAHRLLFSLTALLAATAQAAVDGQKLYTQAAPTRPPRPASPATAPMAWAWPPPAFRAWRAFPPPT